MKKERWVYIVDSPDGIGDVFTTVTKLHASIKEFGEMKSIPSLRKELAEYPHGGEISPAKDKNEEGWLIHKKRLL